MFSLLPFLFSTVLAVAAAAMPFEMNSNKIYLPVKINNKGPAWFILDTGSVSNVIDADQARQLRVVQSESTVIRGAGEGSLPGSIVRDVTLSLDGATMPRGDVEVIPINRAIAYSEGRTVDGLLGCPFFNRFVVQIDYATHQVEFIDPKRFSFNRESETIPFRIEQGNIFVIATAVLPDGKRIDGKFLVDTGWRSALSFTSPFVRAHGLPGTIPTITATSGVGIGGPVLSALGRISALELGKYRIENPVTDFSQTTTGILAESDMAGIIGAEILRRFKVTFDYQHLRMMLESNARFNDPHDFDMSGIYLIAEGENYNVFKAFRVIRNSPAFEAGIREGDFIEAIGEEPASNFTLEQVRQLFREEGRHYRLAIRRDRELMRINMTLRRLI